MTDTADFTIPGYSIVSHLGRGGFAVVYKAIDDRLGRHVAIKVLSEELGDADRRRFDRECLVMGRLSDHPGIVTVHAAGFTSDNRPYLVMRLIAGGSLDERLKDNGKLGWRFAAQVGQKVARAAGYAHAQEILHRDIKPANILMDDDEPRLTDFGIASFQKNNNTSPHTLASWQHASPETFKKARDERSDVYSLGSTLYTLVSGRPPFPRDENETFAARMSRIVNEEPPPLATPSVPAEFERQIMEMLAKDPDQRPQSMAEVEQRLTSVLENWSASEPPRPGPSRRIENTTTDTIPVPGHAQRQAGSTRPPAQTGPAPQEREDPVVAVDPEPADSPKPERAGRRGPLWAGIAVGIGLLAGGFLFTSQQGGASSATRPTLASEATTNAQDDELNHQDTSPTTLPTTDQPSAVESTVEVEGNEHNALDVGDDVPDDEPDNDVDAAADDAAADDGATAAATDGSVDGAEDDDPVEDDDREGYVSAETAHYRVNVPDGWTPIITDQARSYGFRSMWRGPDGSYLIIDTSPNPGDISTQEVAQEQYSYRSERAFSDVEQEPLDRETWSFSFDRDGQEALVLYLGDGPNGYGIVGGHPSDSQLAFEVAREAARSVASTDPVILP